MFLSKIKEDLDQRFERYNRGNTPGLAAMVIQKGEVLFKKGYGLSNLETQKKIDPDTNFRMASVSKQFTGMAIAILEEQGKINCNEPIVQYFPDFPEYGHQITIKHLIHHLSGLPDYFMALCSTDKSAKRLNNQDVFDFLKKKNKLEFTPGSRFVYSNTGYNLLGSLIEKVSDSSYPEFIESHIFRPAQMNHSVVISYPEPDIKNRALGYSEWPFFDWYDYNSGNFLYGEDGVYTSLNDIANWIDSIEQNLLVSPKMQKNIFLGAKTKQGDPVDYGYGWFFEDYHNYKMIAHSGHWVGFNNVVAYFPKKQLWIVAFSNTPDNASWNAMERMAQCYLELK